MPKVIEILPNDLEIQREPEYVPDELPPDEPPESPPTFTIHSSEGGQDGPRWWIIIGGCLIIVLSCIGTVLGQNSIHINWGQDPTPIPTPFGTPGPTAIPGAAPVIGFSDMGPLPGDLCLVDGRPLLLMPVAGDHYMGASLAYIDNQGNLVLWRYDKSLLGSVNEGSKTIMKWAGRLCPANHQ